MENSRDISSMESRRFHNRLPSHLFEVFPFRQEDVQGGARVAFVRQTAGAFGEDDLADEPIEIGAKLSAARTEVAGVDPAGLRRAPGPLEVVDALRGRGEPVRRHR